jgi:5-methyltetrahydrofolate--homocysteine methyltransferase
MPSTLLDRLRQGPPLLMDGAMGSELIRAGLPLGQNGADWSLTRPEAVLAIHRDYIAAGAEVVLTNTFQANPSEIPDLALLSRIGSAAVELARKAGATFVLGDIGPLERAHDFRHVVAALAGTDGILLETFSSPGVLSLAEAMRGRPESRDLPILVSLTFRHGASGIETFSGHAPEWFAERAQEAGIDALGVNCGREIGLADCALILRRFRTKSYLPLFARPNAGTPVGAGTRWEYPRSPEDFAAGVEVLVSAGAAMIGGCCGTTPKHIAAMRIALDQASEPEA